MFIILMFSYILAVATVVAGLLLPLLQVSDENYTHKNINVNG